MRKYNHIPFRVINYCLFCIFLILSILSCSTTHQTSTVKPSGFLGDYSQFQKGGKNQALLVYVNPNAKLSKYDKIMIDPVTVWYNKNSQDAKNISEENMKMLTNYLYTVTRNELQKEYTIVDTPGASVLEIRAAITEASGSNVALDVISNISIPTLLLSSAKRLSTGTHSFVGKAAVEAEVLDSQSKERLLAAVDKRAGRKVLRGKFGTWNDVKEAYDLWAIRLRDRLVQMRSK